MNRWLASHHATRSAPSATSRCGWLSCACTNGAITLSASCGPISTRTAPVAASSAWATGPAPTICFEAPSAEPTAIVEGTSVSTAKNAISAAWPVVRCRRAARQTSTSAPPIPSLGSVSSLHRAADSARSVICLNGTPMTRVGSLADYRAAAKDTRRERAQSTRAASIAAVSESRQLSLV